MRKTPQLLALEAKHGKPAEQIIADAINNHSTITAAADSLGVNVKTFWNWLPRLGIEVKKVARVNTPKKFARIIS